MKPKIPKGWRKLRTGTRVRPSDKFNRNGCEGFERIGYMAEDWPVALAVETVIRRKAK